MNKQRIQVKTKLLKRFCNALEELYQLKTKMIL